MFRGIGAAEQNILVYLRLAGSATVSDIVGAFPKMHPKTVRRPASLARSISHSSCAYDATSVVGRSINSEAIERRTPQP